jgi:hypothetical protein
VAPTDRQLARILARTSFGPRGEGVLVIAKVTTVGTVGEVEIVDYWIVYAVVVGAAVCALWLWAQLDIETREKRPVNAAQRIGRIMAAAAALCCTLIVLSWLLAR